MGKTQKLEQVAYLHIKDQILSENWKSGFHIVEAFISEDLDISRSPIRAALSTLADEGFVDMIPYRGFFVGDNVPKVDFVAHRLRYELIISYRMLDQMIKQKVKGENYKDILDEKVLAVQNAYEHKNFDDFFTASEALLKTILDIGNHDYLVNEALECSHTVMTAILEKYHTDEPKDFILDMYPFMMYLGDLVRLIAENRFNDARVLFEIIINYLKMQLPKETQEAFENIDTYRLA
ncbi:GntR family transcriptional regulator [Aerococcus urinaeequi]|uniref:GntR family transcriptional regulator n=1 Tax=Lactobacillales TaxID=186826 RepID=UPI0003019F03|nr:MULTISPECIES: GntR family transcriptional regulator [Lactobacillales]KAF3300174.1 GntR family transcriptional regulator [Carnobacterium sp. PL26RED25]KAF3304787.1 GntR family transcriptional regulator [Carnobacterium sp. PL24RED07]MDT2762139.1 GntR family transcriptional regulator [Aerococcus urinaeequi]MEB7388880.1 GntR family transcriptional regulator [Aerococcus viridans]